MNVVTTDLYWIVKCSFNFQNKSLSETNIFPTIKVKGVCSHYNRFINCAFAKERLCVINAQLYFVCLWACLYVCTCEPNDRCGQPYTVMGNTTNNSDLWRCFEEGRLWCVGDCLAWLHFELVQTKSNKIPNTLNGLIEPEYLNIIILIINLKDKCVIKIIISIFIIYLGIK